MDYFFRQWNQGYILQMAELTNKSTVTHIIRSLKWNGLETLLKNIEKLK